MACPNCKTKYPAGHDVNGRFFIDCRCGYQGFESKKTKPHHFSFFDGV